MRHVKQLVYGIFYLAFWAALIGGIYALQRPAATCFDGRKNQNETGVDCGGVCAKVCVPDAILPIVTVSEPKLILLGSAVPAATGTQTTGTSTQATGTQSPPRVSVIAEVQNRNLDFGASSFDYTYKIYDQSGAEIASFPGRSFIYPAEVNRPLALLNETLPAGSSPASARLTIQNPIWIPEAKFPRPRLAVQTINTAEANGNLVTQGTLVNQDNIDFPVVYITAIYYDAAGAVLGVSGTERNSVTAGENRDFALFHPMIPNAAPERTKIFVTALNIR